MKPRFLCNIIVQEEKCLYSEKRIQNYPFSALDPKEIHRWYFTEGIVNVLGYHYVAFFQRDEKNMEYFWGEKEKILLSFLNKIKF